MYLRQLNAGAGAARRRGVKHAGGQYLLLINDDTICDPGLLAALGRLIRSNRT
jgi:GT2 family glycosyltransferase